MDNSSQILQELITRYPDLKSCENRIHDAYKAIINSYENGGKLLLCGNGGSAADSDHIAGELLKSFVKKRTLTPEMKDKLINTTPGQGKFLADNLQGSLPAISLTAHTALTTAVINDIGSDAMYAQQVLGLGNKNDVLLGISTSGNAENVINAIIVAKSLNMKTIGLTGKSGGKMKNVCDILIQAPGDTTLAVQELHMPLYHSLCLMIEDHFFKV